MTATEQNPHPEPIESALFPYDRIPVYVPAGGGDCAHGLRRDPLVFFREAYRELVPIFRCQLGGAEIVVMGGLKANEAIWGNNDYWDYHRTNAHFREQFDATYLNQLEGAAFYKKRRRTVQGFKPSVLLAQASGMSRVLFDEVDKLQGQPVEMRIFSMRLYVCMTARVLMQTDLPEGLDRTMAISNRDMLRADTLGKWRHLFYWKPARIWRRRKIFAFLGRIIDERARNPVARDDILSLVLAAHPKDEPPIPRQELIYDLSQLMMGGSTTTSQVILWTLIFLSKDPHWLALLREELAAWDPNQFTGMSNFPRLRATLLEVERLRPPGNVVRRYAARDFSFDGYAIPKGAKVAHLQTLCHFLKEFYDNPLEFRPQRFIDDPTLPHKGVHGLFGGGAHSCVGQPLVRVVAPLLVADIVTRYDVIFEVPLSLEMKIDVVVTPREPEIMARFVLRGKST